MRGHGRGTVRRREETHAKKRCSGSSLWLLRRQWSRNRRFCQLRTVRGRTNLRLWRHAGQRRASHDQSTRSPSTNAVTAQGRLADSPGGAGLTYAECVTDDMRMHGPMSRPKRCAAMGPCMRMLSKGRAAPRPNVSTPAIAPKTRVLVFTLFRARFIKLSSAIGRVISSIASPVGCSEGARDCG